MQTKIQSSFVVDCELLLFQQSFSLRGFIDTGNECIEPMSGKPVHFLSYNAVAKTLPEDFHKALLEWDEKIHIN